MKKISALRMPPASKFAEESAGCHPEAANYFPELPEYQYGLSGHLELVRRAAEALDIPVIASLNGDER